MNSNSVLAALLLLASLAQPARAQEPGPDVVMLQLRDGGRVRERGFPVVGVLWWY